MTEELLERNTSTDDELVFIKEFVVPKSLVFKALTEHEHIKKWKGPKNFHVTYSESELKVGGKYRYGMQSVEGPEIELIGEFKEIDQPDRLVYTQSRLGAAPDGGPSPETVISVTLEEHEGKTRMEFHHAGFPSREFRDGAIHGRGNKTSISLAIEEDRYLAIRTRWFRRNRSKLGSVRLDLIFSFFVFHVII